MKKEDIKPGMKLFHKKLGTCMVEPTYKNMHPGLDDSYAFVRLICPPKKLRKCSSCRRRKLK